MVIVNHGYLAIFEEENSYEIKIDNTANVTGSTKEKVMIRACIWV